MKIYAHHARVEAGEEAQFERAARGVAQGSNPMDDIRKELEDKRLERWK